MFSQTNAFLWRISEWEWEHNHITSIRMGMGVQTPALSSIMFYIGGHLFPAFQLLSRLAHKLVHVLHVMKAVKLKATIQLKYVVYHSQAMVQSPSFLRIK